MPTWNAPTLAVSALTAYYVVNGVRGALGDVCALLLVGRRGSNRRPCPAAVCGRRSADALLAGAAAGRDGLRLPALLRAKPPPGAESTSFVEQNRPLAARPVVV